MPNNTNATPTLADVVNAVNANLPNLTRGKPYSLEQLAGEQYWETIPKGRRNSVGQAFKALAGGGTLPVRYSHTTNGNITMYQLT
jgi:hypothetical protein